MSDPEELFNNNINLAYKFAKRYYKSYEFDEAIQISLLGLWKACLTYDKNKGLALSTYSYKVMQNEFNMLYREKKKYSKYITVSMEENITDNLKISDTLESDINYEEDILSKIEKAEILEDLERYIDSMEDNHAEICRLYFKGYTQIQISKKIGVSQAQVSRVVNKLFDKIKHNFKDKEIM